MALAARLKSLPELARLDPAGEPQAATVAYTLSELETSCRAILSLIPQFSDTSASEDKLRAALLEVGEELRHVMYHVRDTEFFKYLVEDQE